MRENGWLRQLLLVVVVGAIAGCGKVAADSHTKAARDAVAEMQTVSDAIATVTDKSSADAAGEKIETAATNIEAIAQRTKQLPPAAKGESETIRTEIEPQIKAIQSQIHASMDRLHDKQDLVTQVQGPLMKVQMSLMGVEDAIVFGGSSQQQRFPVGAPAPPAAGSPGFSGRASGNAQAKAAAQRAEQRRAEVRQNFVAKFPAEKIVTIEITPRQTFAIQTALYQHVMRLAGVKNGLMEGSGSETTILLGPLDDFTALAGKIDFGKATIDPGNRTIHVDADPAKLAHPPADW